MECKSTYRSASKFLLIIIALIFVFGCNVKSSGSGFGDDEIVSDGIIVISADDIVTDNAIITDDVVVEIKDDIITDDDTLISVVINPDCLSSILFIQLSSEGTLTASLGALSYTLEGISQYFKDHMDFEIYYIQSDFFLEVVEYTANIKLDQIQFQELLDLIGSITEEDLTSRYNFPSFGAGFVDVIYDGRVYAYFTSSLFNGFHPMSPHMRELVMNFIEYSPISFCTTSLRYGGPLMIILPEYLL